jgi:putative nucleotidyltransferase with HDIG domain
MIETVDYGFPVPGDVKKICKILRSHGYNGYIVGGAIRDLLSGRSPRDWDLTTDAKPEEIIDIFTRGYRTIPTGMDYGTVTVMIGKSGYELTTFRSDGEYSDGRRPDTIEYTTDIREDLVRRDFTVNAIAFDPIDKRMITVDNAMNDLKTGIIRAVGDPVERFVGRSGDALRMLRACRLAAVMKFVIEDDTLSAIRECSLQIDKCSAERIRDELIKMLGSDRPSIGFNYMADTGLLKEIIPELFICMGVEQPHRWHKYDVYGHIMATVDAVPNDNLVVRLAALLHDIGKPSKREWHPGKKRFRFIDHEKASARIGGDILGRLKFPKEIITDVIPIIAGHMMALHVSAGRMSNRSIRKMVNDIGPENIENLLLLTRADVIGSGKNMDEGFANIDKLRERLDDISLANNGNPGLLLRDLDINGNDIMGLGVRQGPMIGKLLGILYDKVLDDPSINEKEYLVDVTRRNLYSMALSIYLKYAYPDDPGARDAKMSLLDNPHYFNDGLPKESRIGCHVNGHMKIRVKDDKYFHVDKNDLQDSDDICKRCEEIGNAIEAEWAATGIPVWQFDEKNL